VASEAILNLFQKLAANNPTIEILIKYEVQIDSYWQHERQ
jgi:hypothetical protein